DGAFLGTHLYAAAIAIELPAIAVIALTALVGVSISAVAWTTVPASLRLPLAYALAVTVASVLLVHTEQLSALATDPVAEERYFMVSSMILGAIAIAGLVTRRGRPRLAAVALTGMLLAAVVGDFRLRPHPPHDWATTSACIGGPTPCDVPVEPAGIWTIHWPGSGNL
ncbi:MAG TPA: hypothetical protein VE817_06905, partial [Candidatus Acidoferrum sp.]|nr:hypothetical protein [Candidatus Acidoferrum sp.]